MSDPLILSALTREERPEERNWQQLGSEKRKAFTGASRDPQRGEKKNWDSVYHMITTISLQVASLIWKHIL